MSATRTPFPTAARTLLHDTVLGAVGDLARSQGWGATTMAHVATAAGVSRQTLYNEFGSRTALVEAFVAYEIDQIVEQVVAAVAANADDAHRALHEAFALFLQLASDEPIVQVVLADSAADELHRLLTDVGQRLASERFSGLIPMVWPQVSPGDAAMLANSLVRLAISHALVPSQDPQTLANDVGRMFAPFVDELLGADPGE